MPEETVRARSVAIWIRVSTEDQARGESPQHHEVRARMYAEMRGWHVVRVYDLSGVSGKTVWDHPEAKAMRGDVASGRISALIFSKLARLARNTKELLEFADLFLEAGADLVSLQESIDTSTPAGRLFYTMIAAMAQWEREEIADRVRASVEVRAALGKPTGGQAPYGYRWEENHLMLDESEAPVRALMYELFQEVGYINTVANILNERGYRTRKGGLFTDVTVRRLLTDPLSKGEHRVNYTRSTGAGKKWVLKPEREWTVVEAPAVVSTETFDAVNRRLAERKTGQQPGRPRRYLFSGLVYCACGRKMYRPTRMKKYYCQGCLNKLPEHDLEKVFVEQLRGFFLNPEEIAGHLEQSKGRLDEKRALLETLLSERQSVQRRMDQAFELYLEGGLTPRGFADRNTPLEERRSAIDDELPRVQGEIDALSIDQLTIDAVAGDVETLYASWPDLTFEERRSVVETIVEQVVVGESTIEIKLAYLPPSTHENAAPGKRSGGKKASERTERTPPPHEEVHKSRRVLARAAI